MLPAAGRIAPGGRCCGADTPLRIAAGGGRFAAADHLEKFRDGVVRDVVAADFVSAALNAGVGEHLQLVGLAVVLQALGKALDVFVEAFALLAEMSRVA